MSVIDFYKNSVEQIKERFPIGEIEKFKNTRLNERKTGATELKAALHKHNSAIIAIVSAVMVVMTIVMLIFDGGAGGFAVAGDFLFMLTAAAGVAFTLYFKNNVPGYFIYAFWAAIIAGFMIKLIDFAGNGDFFLTLSVTGIVGLLPIFEPLKLAAFVIVPPVYHLIVSLATGTIGPNNLWTFLSAVVIIVEGVCVYMLMCTRIADRCKIKDEEQKVRMTQKMDRTTGLFNRTYGIEQTDYALSHGLSVAVILVDIDYFAEYNRIYGVAASDNVLARISRCVKVISKPKTDKICRFNDDKIMIVLPTVTDKEPVALAEEIRKSVRTMSIPFPENVGYNTVTVSVSVARSVPNDTCAALCERAESSLRAAKNDGRNCVGFKNRSFRSESKPDFKKMKPSAPVKAPVTVPKPVTAQAQVVQSAAIKGNAEEPKAETKKEAKVKQEAVKKIEKAPTAEEKKVLDAENSFEKALAEASVKNKMVDTIIEDVLG